MYEALSCATALLVADVTRPGLAAAREAEPAAGALVVLTRPLLTQLKASYSSSLRPNSLRPHTVVA